MTAIRSISTIVHTPVSAYPLAIYRILFGFLMTGSTLRFLYKGWIKDFYITPTFHFTYTGFEWVHLPKSDWMVYGLFALLFMAAIFIMIGLYYRLAVAVFFAVFTFIELVDKSYYLNHYYFVSLVSFLLIFFPAHRVLSIDSQRNGWKMDQISGVFPLLLKLQIGCVYFFAGIAKLNHDWLFLGQPLHIWLSANGDLPMVGPLLTLPQTAIFAAWISAIFDLTIPFLLFSKRWVLKAVVVAICFHLATAILFPIGVFPWVMILGISIFIPVDKMQKSRNTGIPIGRITPISQVFFAAFIAFQITIPIRSFLFSKHPNWTEEGFRFSWKVMLIEKGGYTTFRIVNKENGKQEILHPNQILTPLQERMMSTQPDMILQFAHHLKEIYQTKGLDVSVYADAFCTFNGRESQRLICSDQDLSLRAYKVGNNPWIEPLIDSE